MFPLPALVRNSTLLVAGTAASKGLVFVSYLVLTRTLGPTDFGRYSLLFAYLAFFELVADSGLDTLSVRDVARNGHGPDTRRRLGDAVALRFCLLLAMIPLSALTFPLLTGDWRDAPLALLGAMSLIANNRRPSLRSLLEVPYRAALRMGFPTLLSSLAEVAHLALLVWFVGRGGLMGAVAAFTLAPLPFLVVLGYYSIRRLRPDIRPERARLLRLLASATPMIGILLLNAVLWRVDVLMLEAMRSTTEVGLYSAPVRVIEVVQLLPILLMTSVLPIFSRHVADPARVDDLHRTSLRVLTAIVAPVVAFEIAFAGPIVNLLFGPAFRGSTAVLPWLAMSSILAVADIVTGARFVATGAERRNLVLIGWAATTNVAVNVWLIPSHGAIGAAIATGLALAVRILSGFFYSDSRAITGLVVRALVPATLAGLVAFAPAVMFPTARLWLFMLGFVAYCVALYLLGALRPVEMARLIHAGHSVPGATNVGKLDDAD